MIIPGFPMFTVGGAKKLPQFIASSQGSARDSATINLSIPAAAQVGDLMVCAAGVIGAADSNVILTSGWTSRYQEVGVGSGNPGTLLMWKFVTSGDKTTGSFSVTCSAFTTYSIVAVMQVWRNALGVSSTSSHNNSVTSATNASITITKDGNALALFHYQGAAAASNPTVPTQPAGANFDRTVVSIEASQTYNGRMTAATQHNVAAGASGPREWTSTLNPRQSYLIQIIGSDN